MAKEKLMPLLISFTPDGKFLAILSPNGSIKIWKPSDGSLWAEYHQPSGDTVKYTCMACSFVGKKRKIEHATFLLALGANDGNIFVINVFTGATKWKATVHHPGGVAGLAFSNKGRSIYSVGTNGMASELTSDSGELKREFKASKKPISSLAFSDDEKILVAAGTKVHVVTLEKKKELLMFPDNFDNVQQISISENANAMVTSDLGEKHLQVWKCDLSSKSVSSGPVISFSHAPLVLECKNRFKEEEDSLAVLALTKGGRVYVWNLKIASQDEVTTPSKITVKGDKTKAEKQKGDSADMSRVPIFAARLHGVGENKGLTALIAYGSMDSPKFTVVDVINAWEHLVMTAINETEGQDLRNSQSEATSASAQNRNTRKRSTAPDVDVETSGDVIDTGAVDNGEAMDGVITEFDVNEPTMGEKLASLNIQKNGEIICHEKQESPAHTKPPSIDSVDILLKHTLRADDRALLLDCLYTQDEKVIANSISSLSSPDVFKLLHSLLSIIQSRGVILVCALPWLRSLLLQHSSAIMSQESALLAINSLYQLIESRVSTFQSALQLSSCLDYLYARAVDELEEAETITPVIYEDNDDSDEGDEQGSEDAMDTDEEINEGEAFDGISDIDGSFDMSDCSYS